MSIPKSISASQKVSPKSSQNLLRSGPNQAISVLVTSLLVTGVIGGIRQLQGLQDLELSVYDQMVRMKPSPSTDTRLLVVGIDEQDLQEQKKWPLADEVIAELLQKLQKHKPKVIGLDIHRDLPQPPGHGALLEQLEAKNVIVIAKGGDDSRSEVPPPPSVPRERVGFSDLLVDRDNITRRNLMYVESNNRFLPSFSLRLALKFLENPPLKVTEQALIIGSTPFPRLQSDSGGYQMEASGARGWQIMIKYHSPDQIARQVTLREVLGEEVDPLWIQGKVILIGYTAPSVKDVFATPYSTQETDDYLMSGVVIHAQMVSQIIGGVLDRHPQIWFLPQWGEWVWLGLASWLGGMVGWRSPRLGYLIMLTAMGLGGIWFMGFLAFTQSLWLPIVPAFLGLMFTGAITLGQKTYYGLYHDSLTHLPNRRYLLRFLSQGALKRPRETQAVVAMLFVDLDRFKTINEGLSHAAGDYLLVNCARRLQSLPWPKNCLARVGGDEFAICVLHFASITEIENLANQVQTELKKAFIWNDQAIFITASIGIAYQRAGKDFQADELLREAHIAMYRAKDLGKDRYEIFLSTMKAQAQTRWQIEMDLRKAVEREEFELYYQPIICLRSDTIAGFEALIRWPSSQRGFISPAQFIPIAEETGLIVPLGAWILRQACQQIKLWHQLFPSNPPLMMSVNLSGRQFSQPDLVEQMGEILEEVQVQRGCVKLEITEGMMMDNGEEAIALLQQLKGLGLKLSIDDFGTGYSNLSYLHRFPIDTLKVDQSFVRQMYGHQDSDKYKQIVKTVVMLAHNLNLDVIAEGIETEEQRQALKALGCEYGQGYLFSKPLPRQQIEALIPSHPSWLSRSGNWVS